jgi:hypothetical protein
MCEKTKPNPWKNRTLSSHVNTCRVVSGGLHGGRGPRVRLGRRPTARYPSGAVPTDPPSLGKLARLRQRPCPLAAAGWAQTWPVHEATGEWRVTPGGLADVVSFTRVETERGLGDRSSAAEGVGEAVKHDDLLMVLKGGPR